MNTVLFDLDGTLLPMDQNQFVRIYFHRLVTYFQPFGLEAEALIDAINKGINAMVTNDGSMTNEKRFWSIFRKELGDDIQSLEDEFMKFYQTDFCDSRLATQTNPLTKKCIELLKKKGYQIIIATNPLFPQVATYERISWAGFMVSDVSYVTTYETCSFCKPNLNYYNEILARYQLKAKDCMMVGNDVTEDMCVTELGMEVFLLTDCLINKSNADINVYNHGSMTDFYDFVKNLR